jgi:hypothetical protein
MISGSSSPWITAVGALIERSASVRSPDAMMPASWWKKPSGLCARSYDAAITERSRSPSAG